MATAGHFARIEYPSDLISFTDESTSTDDDQEYKIDDFEKSVWCKHCNITVEEDGTPTTEDYTLDRLTGKVIFETVDGTRGVITVSGHYHDMSELTLAFEYELNLSATNEDSTHFGQRYVNRTQTLKDVDGSFSRFFTDEFISRILKDDDELVIRFYTYYDENAPEDFDFIVWAKISEDSIGSAVDGLVEEEVDFEGTLDKDDRAFSTP